MVRRTVWKVLKQPSYLSERAQTRRSSEVLFYNPFKPWGKLEILVSHFKCHFYSALVTSSADESAKQGVRKKLIMYRRNNVWIDFSFYEEVTIFTPFPDNEISTLEEFEKNRFHLRLSHALRVSSKSDFATACHFTSHRVFYKQYLSKSLKTGVSAVVGRFHGHYQSQSKHLSTYSLILNTRCCALSSPLIQPQTWRKNQEDTKYISGDTSQSALNNMKFHLRLLLCQNRSLFKRLLKYIKHVRSLRGKQGNYEIQRVFQTFWASKTALLRDTLKQPWAF